MTPELTPEQRRRVEELFHRAVALPAAPRAAFLDQACAADYVVRHEVEQLLHHHDARTDTARSGDDDTPTTGAALRDAVAVLDDMSGEHVGPYKLLQRIGRGGFGDVYMADQEQPVRRRVALKIIKLGLDTRPVIARFEAERQALAMTDHPHIAKVLDAGATEAQSPIGAGRPYFVMELVKGEPITAYCDREKLSIADRLELFTQLCHAVQHAHQKAVIHRDIKPGNVLVSMVDGRHLAKVIDFGIAKATDHRLTEKTLFTEFHQMIGTPEYMSPEQAGGSLDIDTRTDIYSLGVLLQELLTGTPPFDPKRLRSAAYAEMQRIIREVEPTKPSTRVASDLRVRRSSEPRPSESGSSGGATDDALPEVRGSSVAQIARWRRTDPPSLLRLMRGELDWIVMKCLEKDRARRYTTANDLATDIQRHLCGEPVVAAPPSSTYRLRKFVRRYRGGVSIAGVIALSVAAALVGITTANIEARHDRERAAEAAQRERVRALLGWLQTHNYQGSWNDGDALPDQVTLELICDHIRAAQATPFELETFARAFAKIDFGGRRSVPRADLLLINNASRKRNPAWEGLGMLVSPTLWLDDNRLSFSDTPFIGPASTYSHRVRLLDESVGLGQHQLRGMARVQIVRLLGDQPDMADQHHAVDHEPIAGMYADVEIPAYDFVVVDAYPAGYPPRINLPEVAQEYQDGFLLESCFLRRGRGSRLLANSPLSRYLVLTISFPTPKMTIACNVSLSVNGAEPREAYRITMTVDGILRTSSPWPLGASVYSLDTVAWGPALAA